MKTRSGLTPTDLNELAEAKKLKSESPELYEEVRRGAITLPKAKRERRNTLNDCTLAKLREMLAATERTAPNGPAVKIIREAIERAERAERAAQTEARQSTGR